MTIPIAAGSHYNQKGGGANYQCIKLQDKSISWLNFMYSTCIQWYCACLAIIIL